MEGAQGTEELFEELGDDTSGYLVDNCKPELMPPAQIRHIPTGTALPREFAKYYQRIRDFQVRSDDVWVISYPKCGTIWTQEMVWLLGNNLDYAGAKKQLIYQRFPFLEAVGIISEEQKKSCTGEGEDDEWVFRADTITYCDEMPSPRYIKSHLPVQLLPKQIWEKKPKIIYVTREVKDVAVSYYHHHRLWNGYTGTYDKFMDAFLEDKLVYSPFWEHVLEYKKLENEPNVLINSYEEMIQNLSGVVRKTAEFLGGPIPSDEDLEGLVTHLGFTKMKENWAINGEELIREVVRRHRLDPNDPDLNFIRRGVAGAWRSIMTVDLSQRFDDWTKAKTTST